MTSIVLRFYRNCQTGALIRAKLIFQTSTCTLAKMNAFSVCKPHYLLKALLIYITTHLISTKKNEATVQYQIVEENQLRSQDTFYNLDEFCRTFTEIKEPLKAKLQDQEKLYITVFDETHFQASNWRFHEITTQQSFALPAHESKSFPRGFAVYNYTNDMPNDYFYKEPSLN